MDKIVYKPKILVRESKIMKIAHSSGCKSRAAVYNALAFKTNSQLAVNIRNVACSLYGAILVKRYPELMQE